jgi:Xaa-Pro aminopeptidase
MRFVKLASLLVALLARSPASAQGHMGIDPSEWHARREAVMAAAADGVVLLHANSGPKSWSDAGFQQDSNFYYLTGLQNLHGAILALDAKTRQTWLFVMPPGAPEQRRFSDMTGWDSAYLTPGRQSEQLLGVDHVVAWDEFTGFIDAHRKADPELALYLDEGGQGKMVADVSNPPGLSPIENPFVLWSAAITTRWPDARIKDAGPILRPIRAVKSPAEVILLRTAAGYTDAAFRAAIGAITPGRTNRQVEGVAVDAAMRAGADGVGMWPEVRSGPVSGTAVYQKFYDYHLRNRTLRAGETLLMDLGFNHELYKGDVGRTLPVSGRFTPDQREVIDLMDGAYQAGLRAMRNGVSADEVIATSIHYVADHKAVAHSDLARRAAVQLLRPAVWVMYTHGVDAVEIFPVKELHTGYAVAYGPDFNVDGIGFYEEDVSLITPTGHELINPALPYKAADIERTMALLKRSASKP